MRTHASDRAVGMQRRNGAIPGAQRVTPRTDSSGETRTSVTHDGETTSAASIVGDSDVFDPHMYVRADASGIPREEVRVQLAENRAERRAEGQIEQRGPEAGPQQPERLPREPSDPDEGGSGRASGFARALLSGYLTRQRQQRRRKATHGGPGGFQSGEGSAPSRGSSSALGWAIAQIQRSFSDAPGRTVAGPSALRFTQGNLSAGPGARPPMSVGVKPIG